MKFFLSPHRRKNQKGQVALFIALIFQLLFLFFAMVVNVGLLVHHKINLQNSVDLAAYYGAMKQAEMMNAMAHVNYQIRQSWKLIAWRYRMLGAGGDRTSDSPYSFEPNKQIDPRFIDLEGEHPTKRDFYRKPSFCIDYYPIKKRPNQAANENQNLCRQLSVEGSAIDMPQIPAMIAGFIGAAQAARNFTIAARNSITFQCKQVGPFNYKVLGQLVVGFNFDQLARRRLIAKMARGLSQSTDDFVDLDGQSGKLGIENTLRNNLTEANRNSVQIEVLNGLNQGGCHGSPSGEYGAPGWLSEVAIFPFFAYTDMECDSAGSKLKLKARLLDYVQLPKHYMDPDLPAYLKGDIDNLKQFLGFPPVPYEFTLGYEKNPWCMAYVGVKAKSRPKIPFSPADFELSARAFAKPFGGRFGPWYYKTWPSTSPTSVGSNDPAAKDTKLDQLVPQRLSDPGKLAGIDPFKDLQAANFSRFVGDQLGLTSVQVIGQYVRAIHEVATQTNNLSLFDWDNLIFDNSGNFYLPEQNQVRDMLSWDILNDKPGVLRDVEAAVVAPDLFDITYYSIDPNFYDNYFKKISAGQLLQKIGYQWPLRSDLGSRFGKDPKLEAFSVKDQIEAVKSKVGNFLDHDQHLTHVVRDPFHVLTSWVSEDLLDYSNVPQSYFGKCLRRVDEVPSTKKTPYPGDCILGGASGYSVKIVASDYLQSQLELGGAAGGKSKIKNAPDPQW